MAHPRRNLPADQLDLEALRDTVESDGYRLLVERIRQMIDADGEQLLQADTWEATCRAQGRITALRGVLDLPKVLKREILARSDKK